MGAVHNTLAVPPATRPTVPAASGVLCISRLIHPACIPPVLTLVFAVVQRSHTQAGSQDGSPPGMLQLPATLCIPAQKRIGATGTVPAGSPAPNGGNGRRRPPSPQNTSLPFRARGQAASSAMLFQQQGAPRTRAAPHTSSRAPQQPGFACSWPTTLGGPAANTGVGRWALPPYHGHHPHNSQSPCPETALFAVERQARRPSGRTLPLPGPGHRGALPLGPWLVALSLSHTHESHPQLRAHHSHKASHQLRCSARDPTP